MTRAILSLPRNVGEKIRFRIFSPFCPVALQWHSFDKLKNLGGPNSGSIPWILQCPKRRDRKEGVEIQSGFNNGYCAACEYWQQEYRYADNNTGDVRPYQRYYYKVFDRAEVMMIPKMLPVSVIIHKKIVGLIVGGLDGGGVPRQPLGDITDLRNGRDLTISVPRIERSGSFSYPAYEVTPHQPSLVHDIPRMVDEVAEFFADWPDNFEDLYQNDGERIKEVIEYEYKGRKRRRQYRCIDAPWLLG